MRRKIILSLASTIVFAACQATLVYVPPPIPPIPPVISKVIAGYNWFTGQTFSCLLTSTGKVKCWGDNQFGQLGYEDTQNRGDSASTVPSKLPWVNLGTGRKAIDLYADVQRVCATLDDNKAKCWGANGAPYAPLNCYTNPASCPGAFGYLGNSAALVGTYGGNPGEMGDGLPYLIASEPITKAAAAAWSGCSLSTTGNVSCWIFAGVNTALNLGTNVFAKDIVPGKASQCYLMTDNRVKCTGLTSNGRVGGTGSTAGATLGDIPAELGDALAYVDWGTSRTVKSLSQGSSQHYCAVLDNDRVKCFGPNTSGQLGLGDTTVRGNLPAEMGDALPYVNLGTTTPIIQVAVGGDADGPSCALDNLGRVKCWGYNLSGQLGLGDTTNRGTLPADMGTHLPFVKLGTNVQISQISLGFAHGCALTANSRVKCWGDNTHGGLGYGDTVSRGATPNTMGDNLPYVDTGKIE